MIAGKDVLTRGAGGEMMEISPLALVSIVRQREDATYGSLDPVDAESLSEDLRVRCLEAIERYRAEHGGRQRTV
jgi:hypothetical protein